jgi:hypothetical protein
LKAAVNAFPQSLTNGNGFNIRANVIAGSDDTPMAIENSWPRDAIARNC